jgi:hypothetical protein
MARIRGNHQSEGLIMLKDILTILGALFIGAWLYVMLVFIMSI